MHWILSYCYSNFLYKQNPISTRTTQCSFTEFLLVFLSFLISLFSFFFIYVSFDYVHFCSLSISFTLSVISSFALCLTISLIIQVLAFYQPNWIVLDCAAFVNNMPHQASLQFASKVSRKKFYESNNDEKNRINRSTWSQTAVLCKSTNKPNTKIIENIHNWLQWWAKYKILS